MRSTLFLNKMTVLDHGWIDADGRVRGGSFTPDIEVSGPVTEDENVVIDFSTCKKDLKNFIDDYDDGWDHHLLILEPFSNVTSFRSVDENSDLYQLVTPACELVAPRSMFKFVSAEDYDFDCLGEALSAELTAKMAPMYPGVEVKVKMNDFCFLVDEELNVYGFFRYVHGLAQSTSCGCQRHSHGHLSFYEMVLSDAATSDDYAGADLIGEDIDQFMNDAILIYDKNVVEDTPDFVSIRYISRRGDEFFARYKREFFNIIIMPHETTVEHIVNYLYKKYGDAMRSNNVIEFRVSEGTQKGAMMPL